jgi:hypothetical protein
MSNTGMLVGCPTGDSLAGNISFSNTSRTKWLDCISLSFLMWLGVSELFRRKRGSIIYQASNALLKPYSSWLERFPSGNNV